MTATDVSISPDIDEFFTVSHIVRPGETISSTSLHKRAGGKGANQAFAAARASGVENVLLDASIGSDGEWIKETLRGAGVMVERVATVDEEMTGRAIIQSAADGENSIGG
jgi:ribokinase